MDYGYWQEMQKKKSILNAYLTTTNPKFKWEHKMFNYKSHLQSNKLYQTHIKLPGDYKTQHTIINLQTNINLTPVQFL